MGLFDFFKSKKEETRHYDPTNMSPRDLGKGYILEYNLETWTVTSFFEYDWGDNYFTREFVLTNGNKKRFLEIEDDDGLNVIISKKVKKRKLDEGVWDHFAKKNEAPKKLTYDGITYFLNETSNGFIKEIDASSWEELVSYTFMDAEEEKILSIVQYGEDEFEISKGKKIAENAISNILPIAEN